MQFQELFGYYFDVIWMYINGHCVGVIAMHKFIQYVCLETLLVERIYGAFCDSVVNEFGW